MILIARNIFIFFSQSERFLVKGESFDLVGAGGVKMIADVTYHQQIL